MHAQIQKFWDLHGHFPTQQYQNKLLHARLSRKNVIGNKDTTFMHHSVLKPRTIDISYETRCG